MSEKIKTAIMEIIKAHMDGEDKNTKAVLSDVMKSVNELEILEQQPCEKPMTVDEMEREYEKSKALFHKIVECDNTISREDMLDAIGHGTTYTSEELQRIIQNLPPFNPKPCDDAVSRQAVKEQLNCWIGSGEYRYAMSERFLIDRINDLPSVTQKYTVFHCPKCGYQDAREL